MRRRGGRKRALGTRAPMVLHKDRTSAGASTSSPTFWQTVAGSVFSWWSTTSRENAWSLLRTDRYRVFASPASLIGSRPSADGL